MIRLKHHYTDDAGAVQHFFYYGERDHDGDKFGQLGTSDGYSAVKFLCNVDDIDLANEWAAAFVQEIATHGRIVS